MTLRECIQIGGNKLLNAGIENGMQEAWYLLSYQLQIDRVYYLANMEKTLSRLEEERYNALIERRSSRYPLQYITGTQEFMGYEFIVNEQVLIPRQDTETLIEEIEAECKNADSILDMCTGSGCIAISLEKELHPKRVVGVDLSEGALEVARANAKALNSNAVFIKSDLFKEVSGKYDIIVSNPPYIKSKDCEALMPEVRDYEPMLALDGKEDGLYFYRIIIEEALHYLNPRGFLFFEIGYDQGTELMELLLHHGYYNIQIKKDLAGLDRVAIARHE